MNTNENVLEAQFQHQTLKKIEQNPARRPYLAMVPVSLNNINCQGKLFSSGRESRPREVVLVIVLTLQVLAP